MNHLRSAGPCALLATLFFCACAGEQQLDAGLTPAVTGYSGPIYVWNRSQFELLEVRTHPDVDYANAPDQLPAPLSPGAGILVDIPFRSHLTALRHKVDEGDLWALTTATPLEFLDELNVVLIFDDGFRTMSQEEAAGLEGYAGPGSP